MPKDKMTLEDTDCTGINCYDSQIYHLIAERVMTSLAWKVKSKHGYFADRNVKSTQQTEY